MEKLKRNGFIELDGRSMIFLTGGAGQGTNSTTTATICNNLTGCTETRTTTVTDNPDGSKCETTTWKIEC